MIADPSTQKNPNSGDNNDGDNQTSSDSFQNDNSANKTTGSVKKPFVILAVIGSAFLYVAFTVLVIKAYRRSKARTAGQQQGMTHV